MQTDMNHITQNEMIKLEIQPEVLELVISKKIILQKLKYLQLKQDCEDYQTIANKPQHNWSSG